LLQFFSFFPIPHQFFPKFLLPILTIGIRDTDETRLEDRIEGRCSGLEDRVAASEQRSEERLISLEMARSEVEQS
jgi:hypothetical protein